MRHNEGYLLKIKRWGRGLSWYLLVGLFLELIALINKILTVGQRQEWAQIMIESDSFFSNAAWIIADISSNIYQYLGFLFSYLLLLAILKTILYLLALKREVLNRQGYDIHLKP